MAQSFSALFYHLVFSTKKRYPFLTPAIRPSIYSYIGGIVRNQGGQLHAIGGTSDHVHQLVSLTKNMAISGAVREIKSKSSIKLRQQGKRKFRWQSGYSIFTVSPSKVTQLKGYIENQEEHHLKRTFKEELRTLLQAHGVEFDERYLVD